MLFSLGACEEKLTDLDPIDQIPAEKAIQNLADVTNAVNGVYGTWQQRRIVYINSFISDEIRLGTGTEYRNVGNILFNWQHVSDSQDWRDGETGGVWTNLYAVIDRCNRILELMVPVPTANATEEATKKQLRGEMLALRAMAHFELLRFLSETVTYSPDALGVVLMTEYAKAPGAFQPARNKQSEVVAQINADLTEAKGLIPTTWTDISRITRNAVTATQAKVALHTRNFQETIDRANEVITAQPITPRASYAALWTTRNLASTQATEVIWKYNVNTSNLGFAIGSLYQDVGTGAVQASPAQELLNLYDQANDIRFSTFFRVPPATTRNLIAKYGVVIGTNGENFLYDIKAIRTSEILLARAEAQAELNLLTAANASLSQLRSARILNYTHTDITSKDALIAAIIEEGYKELPYEGVRYHTLRRRNLPIDRLLADAGGIATSQNLPTSNAKYILPIPQQETFANLNMQQNTGY